MKPSSLAQFSPRSQDPARQPARGASGRDSSFETNSSLEATNSLEASSSLETDSVSTGKASGTGLTVDRIEKSYVDSEGKLVRAVDGVSFSLKPGEFYTLLGPSGCGKTTTLRCVAGLESVTAGSIAAGGRVLSDPARRLEVPPHLRRLGMVFQSYAIWPHMTVAQNVAFPLEVGPDRPAKAEIANRVEEALVSVELGGYGSRMATQLSGGQQQRLALARALVGRPGLLLLDEPLSNLDAKLRGAMRAELRRLQRRIGVTTLYVTHDQVEALSMSNRIAVMNGGKIVQEGRPEDVYRKPNSPFVAEFLGNSNFLKGKRAEGGDGEADGFYTIDGFGGEVLRAPLPEGLPVGASINLVVRYEGASLVAADDVRANTVPGRINQVMYLGESIHYHIGIGDGEVIVRTGPAERRFGRKETVRVLFPPSECIVISDEYGVSASG